MKTDCVEWPRGKNPGGYGIVYSYAEKRQLKAHRHVWQECFGWIPDGMNVLHRCDNPPCVNPEHLFLGTQVDNVRDREEKGRGGDRTGEKNGLAVLTWEKVKRMRTMHKKNGISTRKLAAIFRCNPSTIQRVINGKTWRDQK